MKNLFLKAKHWQLFTVFLALPLIFQFYFSEKLNSILKTGTEMEFMEVLGLYKLFILISLISSLLFFGWHWSVVMGLQKKIPAELRFKTGLFKLSFGFMVIYLISFIVGVFYISEQISLFGFEILKDYISYIGLTIFFILIAFASSLYIVYCVAKTIKLAEIKEEITGTDFVGEFFLTLVNQVGIWLLQPRINKLINDDTTTNEKKEI